MSFDKGLETEKGRFLMRLWSIFLDNNRIKLINGLEIFHILPLMYLHFCIIRLMWTSKN